MPHEKYTTHSRDPIATEPEREPRRRPLLPRVGSDEYVHFASRNEPIVSEQPLLGRRLGEAGVIVAN